MSEREGSQRERAGMSEREGSQREGAGLSEREGSQRERAGLSEREGSQRERTVARPRPVPARLRGADLARLGGAGLRARPLRAVLSALGIAIGIAAMVAVL